MRRRYPANENHCLSKEHEAGPGFIHVTGHGDVRQGAVNALRDGAFDLPCVKYPVDAQQTTCRTVVRQKRIHSEKVQATTRKPSQYSES